MRHFYKLSKSFQRSIENGSGVGNIEPDIGLPCAVEMYAGYHGELLFLVQIAGKLKSIIEGSGQQAA